MCGIVGATTERHVAAILLEGLRRLEYRGYDSAGLAVYSSSDRIERVRAVGKVSALESEQARTALDGRSGIAHTRWATHGKPTVANAHPHMSQGRIAIVHNGIVENYEALRDHLKADGYTFESETDSEVIAHLLDKLHCTTRSFPEAFECCVRQLSGAYALAAMNDEDPGTLMVARQGSPLVIGVGLGENFVASDPLALLQVTDRFIYLEEGDTACVSREKIQIRDKTGAIADRPVLRYEHGLDSVEKGLFRHFMAKEIFEQPRVLAETLEGRIAGDHVLQDILGSETSAIFDRVQQIQIVACGTSYHAGLVARYWIEEWLDIPCQTEVASEFRYRKSVVRPGTLFVTISQSGETADTLSALRLAKQSGFETSLTICNVAGSSLVRESDCHLLTRAGTEIGVASTKAFTTQLAALMVFALALGRHKAVNPEKNRDLVEALRQLPGLAQSVLDLDGQIQKLAETFADRHHSLFLGRGTLYPVAMEGALKLKEISYIHAEAYPAGELKHGPLALVDKDMPVIAVAPNNELLEKLKSNLQEVSARGGKLIVFAEESVEIGSAEDLVILKMPAAPACLAPILYTIPLQLLAYHVAVLKGTDVDQPRNLAKSVTVE